MKKILITCSALALVGYVGQASAQDAATSSTPAATTQAAAASNPQAPTSADLTGQTIYDEHGSALGTVSSVSTDAQGQQQAVVGVEKFLGMGGRNVLFPVTSLQPRTGGGYTTSLTSSDIKNLPEARSDTH
jgi:hypothetical protein